MGRQSVSHPVDTQSGAFWHTFADLSTPGRGPALDLTRTYDSVFASQDGLFGHGWTSSYSMSLYYDPSTGDITINQENGSTIVFLPASGGGYTPAQPRELATLVPNADGSFTFTREKKQIFGFNPAGQLVSEKDLHGYTTTLNYTAGGVEFDHRFSRPLLHDHNH